MRAEEARIVAENLISRTDFKKCSMKFAEIRESKKFPQAWLVVFDLICPNGCLLDAPTVVVVDHKSAEARILPSL